MYYSAGPSSPNYGLNNNIVICNRGWWKQEDVATEMNDPTKYDNWK